MKVIAYKHTVCSEQRHLLTFDRFIKARSKSQTKLKPPIEVKHLKSVRKRVVAICVTNARPKLGPKCRTHRETVITFNMGTFIKQHTTQHCYKQSINKQKLTN